jgi:uncharacterized delta-60 repeat protein
MNAQTNNPGELDPSFGNNGMFELTLAPPYQETIILGALIDSATQNIYFAGQARNGISDRPYILGRLSTDGNLDNTFATQGIAMGKFSHTAESRGNAIALLAEDKILLIGATIGSPALARFHRNGSIDTSYGVNGHLILIDPWPSTPLAVEESASEAESAQSHTVALQDGRILISFTYHQSGNPTHSFLFMLDIYGELDRSFNQTGSVLVKHPDHPPENIRLHGCLIDDDGSVVACASLKFADSQASMFVRYTTVGNIESSYGENGYLVVDTHAEYALVDALAKQGNRRILAIGYSRSGFNYSGLMISHEWNGSANIQFNRGQPLLTRLNDSDTQWISASKQPNGSLVVTGNSTASGKPTIALARLQSNGAFDPTFNNGQGWVVTSIGLNHTSAKNVALQDDGKILVCGFYRETNLRAIILRYLG